VVVVMAVVQLLAVVIGRYNGSEGKGRLRGRTCCRKGLGRGCLG
jgi:hypothetical protein